MKRVATEEAGPGAPHKQRRTEPPSSLGPVPPHVCTRVRRPPLPANGGAAYAAAPVCVHTERPTLTPAAAYQLLVDYRAAVHGLVLRPAELAAAIVVYVLEEREEKDLRTAITTSPTGDTWSYVTRSLPPRNADLIARLDCALEAIFDGGRRGTGCPRVLSEGEFARVLEHLAARLQAPAFSAYRGTGKGHFSAGKAPVYLAIQLAFFTTLGALLPEEAYSGGDHHLPRWAAQHVHDPSDLCATYAALGDYWRSGTRTREHALLEYADGRIYSSGQPFALHRLLPPEVLQFAGQLHEQALRALVADEAAPFAGSPMLAQLVAAYLLPTDTCLFSRAAASI